VLYRKCNRDLFLFLRKFNNPLWFYLASLSALLAMAGGNIDASLDSLSRCVPLDKQVAEFGFSFSW